MKKKSKNLQDYTKSYEPIVTSSESPVPAGLLVVALVGLIGYYAIDWKTTGAKVLQQGSEIVQEGKVAAKDYARVVQKRVEEKIEQHTSPEREQRLEREQRRSLAKALKKAGADLSLLNVHRSPLKKVSGLYPSPARIFEDDHRRVWVATKYDLTMFPNAQPEQAAKMLIASKFRETTGAGLSALSSVALLKSGEMMTGSWHGVIMRSEGNLWKVLSDGEITGRVAGIIEYDGTLYVAARSGLWHWNRRLKTFQKVPGSPGQIENIVTDPDGRMYLGTRDGVWHRPGGKWRKLWPESDKRIGVTGLYVSGDRKLFAGTRDGYVEISLKGKDEKSSLPGEWVTSFFQESPERLWVGTWKSGLFVREKGVWYSASQSDGLENNQVHNLLVDSRSQLWVGLYGKGTFVGNASEILTWIRDRDSD